MPADTSASRNRCCAKPAAAVSFHNVRYANTSVSGHLAAVDRAPIGVLAFIGPAGRPVACPVTPFVDGEDVVVTSVLALLGKVTAIRQDPRVAILAGGVELRGNARVQLDETGDVFRSRLQRQELRKYPPSRMLLRLPFHRRFLWWYAGRAIIRLSRDVSITPGSDRVTLTHLGTDGRPRIVPLTCMPCLDGPVIDLRSVGLDEPLPSGPACLLVHDEYSRYRDLRQLRLGGDIADGRLEVRRRAGSLRPGAMSVHARLSGLRGLSNAAKANRALLAAWRAESSIDAEVPTPETARSLED